MEYYEWLFFGNKRSTIIKWAQHNDIDMGTQSIPDFFRICVQLAGADQVPPTFAHEMWKRGKKRLAIGLLVEVDGPRYPTQHMISVLEKNTFVDMDGERVVYEKIRRVVTVPKRPKYDKKNLQVGMKLKLVNKNGSKNIYTITALNKNGFDAKNGDYLFFNLEYGSIANVL